MMLATPILLIIFNRPETTQQVFDAIRFAMPKRLYVAADAPRPGYIQDIEKCTLTRAIVQQVDWDCQVQYLFQENNLGCSLGPRTAFDWFFAHEEEGIILEDDCVPHPDFFRFATEMLEKYRFDQRIISINGCNLGYTLENGYSYTCSRFMNMWGWATWKRSAQQIDYTLKKWRLEKYPLQTLYRLLRQHPFDTDINWYKYWKDKFDRTITDNKVTWWDWQWIYYQLDNQQLSIVPAKNLVSNIGFSSEGTHTKEQNNPAANLPGYSLDFPLKHPTQIKPDMHYEEAYVKWVWCYHKRLPTSFYIKRLLKQIFTKHSLIDG